MIVRVHVVLNRTFDSEDDSNNNNSPIQDYVHPENHTQPTIGIWYALKTEKDSAIFISILIFLILLLIHKVNQVLDCYRLQLSLCTQCT